jgi:hypothetical protein
MSYDSGMTLVQLNAVTAERDALLAELAEATGYATTLATAIHAQHYAKLAPQWKPLDTVLGVLTQIDNMTCGLAAPSAQPEACFCDRNNLGVPGVSCGDCPTRDYKQAAPVIYSPIATDPQIDGCHPNDNETKDPERKQYLDLRGDDEGQGLDGYWKWGHAAGWNDHKRHVGAAPVSAEDALVQAVKALLDMDVAFGRGPCVYDAVDAVRAALAAKGAAS